jgi:hypothetical protein
MTVSNTFPHDATNLEAYPWISICMLTYGYLWIIPLLKATSKGFASILSTPHVQKDLRVAIKMKGIANVFLSKSQQLQLKQMLCKHLWMIWHKPDKSIASNKLADVIKTFMKGFRFCTISETRATSFGLSDLSWTVSLKLVVRLAIWMHYYGLNETMLYTLFMTRMDIGWKKIQRMYPYNIKNRPCFSGYIEQIIQKGDVSLWIWTINSYPVDCYLYRDMAKLWFFAQKNTYYEIISSLPKVIQASLALMSIYSQLSKSRSNGDNVGASITTNILLFKAYILKCRLLDVET